MKNKKRICIVLIFVILMTGYQESSCSGAAEPRYESGGAEFFSENTAYYDKIMNFLLA
jgi:hypothetical protein